jgi:hypothetical protein
MEGDPNRVNPLAGPIAGRHLAHMTGKDQEREERLAAALRENLRRRKAQSREMDAGEKRKPDES